ncbi:MAG: ABC transporter permease, partial [Sediminibacterium sp.]
MSFFTHFGTFLLMLKGMFTKPENWRMYWKEFMHQCVEIGIGALPIVVIISIFLGAVTTVQTAYQLVSPLVPLSTIAQIVRDSMILELSPTVLSIVLAGVVGSKIASELGNMRISEQIDALEIMGINSKSYLIMPKILAALLVIPCLIVISAVLGIWGGRTAGAMSGILANDIFDAGLRQNLNLYNINFALYKSYTFAFILSSVPAYYGYNVKG